MKLIKYLLSILFVGTLLVSCKKSEYDAAKQLQADEVLIKEFIAKNNLNFQRHETGVYYQIVTPGSGNLVYGPNTKISVKYAGRLLNGQVFDQGGFEGVPLGQLIQGWHVGVPLIQKGGKIRVLIPSPYGYAQSAVGSIPPNSVLDFDIELIDAQN